MYILHACKSTCLFHNFVLVIPGNYYEVPLTVELPTELPVKMSTSLAVGMIFSSLNAANDALLHHTVSCGESFKKHKQTSICYIVACCSKNYHIIIF